jgi:hypothetical protein
MKLFSLLAMCGLVLLPVAFAGSIDFETGAPAGFAQTTALTNAYAALGVTFSGPGANDGGAILDQLGNFGVSAHSGVDFLAFNNGATLNGGGVPRGPETILFSAPVFNVGLWVGGESSGSTYTLEAFDASSSSLGSAIVTPGSGQWSQLSIDTANISRLVLSFDRTYAVVDDLTWNGNESGVPEPSTLALLGAGIAVLAGTARRRRA